MARIKKEVLEGLSNDEIRLFFSATLSMAVRINRVEKLLVVIITERFINNKL